eukprot:6044660-Ditylum_brightwellii.AAC.1
MTGDVALCCREHQSGKNRWFYCSSIEEEVAHNGLDGARSIGIRDQGHVRRWCLLGFTAIGWFIPLVWCILWLGWVQ